MNKILLLVLLLLGTCGEPSGEGTVEVASGVDARFAAAKLQAEAAIREIDTMRSALAKTIGGDEVNQETFAKVCKPVGLRAREIGEENGWVVQQLAMKFRNPANMADTTAVELFARFEGNPALDSLWFETASGSTSGWRYLRRIEVEPACLACHGAKGDRPDFIVSGYPEDRAFDFEIGDLRGLYSVFVPDSTWMNGRPR